MINDGAMLMEVSGASAHDCLHEHAQQKSHSQSPNTQLNKAILSWTLKLSASEYFVLFYPQIYLEIKALFSNSNLLDG
jgi:hypothetical protein